MRQQPETETKCLLETAVSSTSTLMTLTKIIRGRTEFVLNDAGVDVDDNDADDVNTSSFIYWFNTEG